MEIASSLAILALFAGKTLLLFRVLSRISRAVFIRCYRFWYSATNLGIGGLFITVEDSKIQLLQSMRFKS